MIRVSAAVGTLVMGALLLGGLCGAAPRREPAFDPSQLAFDERPGAELPLADALRDSDGQVVRLGDLAHGVPLILVLGYFHCPNLCGVVRASLYRALGASGLEPGRDFALAAVSIDPAETVEQARSARQDDAASFPAARPASFHYLVATGAQIASISRAIGFHARRETAAGQFIHPAGVVFATPGGRVSSYLLGVGYRSEEVRAAVKRARSGDIAARTASPILLLCFHFDASTGRYTLDVLRVLRLGAIVTAALLAVLLLRMARHRRRSCA
jgi:protein SCO1/2